MKYTEEIQKRKSRRTYLQTTIESKSKETIQELINDINKKSDLSIEFIENGENAFNSIGKSYGMFKGVRSLIALKGLKSDIHLKEKSGYYGELIILEATKLGLGTCWVGGTFDRKNSVFNIGENQELTCVIAIGNVPKEATMKEKIIYKLSHRKTKTLEEMYTSDVTAPKWFITAMESVQKAPSAINSQKVKFDYKEGVIRAEVPNTYTLDLIDLGIAKLHFELASNGHFNLGNNEVYVVNDN